MKVYRISKKKHIASLSGTGAELAGGRWNIKGVRAVYTASSRALAMAETLVQPGFEQIPGTYHIAQINIPDTLKIYFVDMSAVDFEKWWTIGHSPITKEIGTALLRRNKFPVIRVPSIVVKGDFNFILNPYHGDSKRFSIDFTEAFPFDCCLSPQ